MSLQGSIVLLSSLLTGSLASPSGAANRARHLLVQQNPAGNELRVSGVGRLRVTGDQISNARLLDLEGEGFAVLWDESSNGQIHPFYALSLDGGHIARVVETSYELKLRSARTDANSPQSAQASYLFSTPDGSPQIIQFHTQPLLQYRRQLESMGVTIYRFLANHALIVAPISPDTGEQIRRLPYVRAMRGLRLIDKLAEELTAAQIGRSAEPTDLGEYDVEVFERGLAQQSLVADFVRSAGGSVQYTVPSGFRLRVSFPSQLLSQLAALPQVSFIEPAGQPEIDYDIARQIGGQDYIEDTAGFSGEGVRGEVLDVGLRATHVAFQANPVIIHGRTPSVSSHGTSTYGINFGDGTGNLRGRGGVPNGQGIFATYLGLTDRYTHTAELLREPYFAVYQSNSWGDTQTTEYTEVSREMDDILFLDDILICQSQSNSGRQISRPQAWAKNIVSVGGINHFGSLIMADHRWDHSGSIGPAADGRIKPDLAHFYDRVIAPDARTDSDYTDFFGGTSAATPVVASYFGIFFEMWHRGVFGNTTGDTVFSSRPHMTTAKAMILNTARQWPFSGLTHDLTRTHQGWGLPDLRGLYDLRGQILWINETDVLQELQSTAYPVLSMGDGPLKATLVYKDPPGTTSSTVHRINDLSLRVTSPSDVVYWGNNGLLEEMWSAAGGNEDHINTVENVFVQFPEPGVWTVEVIASEINQDAHLQTPEVDADYALVVTGIRPQ